MTLPIFFCSGLPRSGSTLLQNLLGQCPRHHVTGTNDLLDCLVRVRDSWMTFEGFKSQGLKVVESRIRSMLRAMLFGFYESEITADKLIFDKSRGHLAYIELLEEILERQIRIIVTVRDIRAMVASFEKLHRRSAMTKHAVAGPAYFDVQTIDGRARQLLSGDAVLGLAIRRLLDVYDRGLGDRLIIVPYRELTEQPQQTMARLHVELGLPPFVYDSANVEQITQEDDAGHGMELHAIRSKVEAETVPPWLGILSERTCEWLVTEYSDVQALAHRQYLGDMAARLRTA